MYRRKFIKDSGVFAIGIGIFGNIHWNGSRFIGDSPTTTDILGPFYRPGAPIRTNINPADFTGELLHLDGRIFKEDGKTPFRNCLVEIWQCDSKLEYDNISDDYRHRGAQKTGADGSYHFITTQPFAYPIRPGSSVYRPAHIHMRISGEGQQDLITQIYFTGDPYIKDDPGASSPEAVKRIMTVAQNKQQQKQVIFDIIMAKEFKADNNVLNKISGVYTMSDNSLVEFYPEGDMLFMKWNGQIREALTFKGDNEFIGGMGNRNAKFHFEADGKVRVKLDFISAVKKEFSEYREHHLEGVKSFKYPG